MAGGGSPDRETVRQALKELELKTRLLEEERDYYRNLQLSSTHAFEDHRAELQLLISKEREYSARREQSLQNQLESILAENRALHSAEMQARADHNTRISGAMEQLQRDSSARESRLRSEIELCQAELRKFRTQNAELDTEISAIRQTSNELRLRHSVLTAQAKEASEYNSVLAEAQAAEEAKRRAQQAARRAAQARLMSPRQFLGGKSQPCFLPSGKVAKDNMTVPSSHNAQTFVSAVRKGNYRSPRRVDPNPAFTPEYEVLCTSIVKELEELRREYNLISSHIGDSAPTDSAAQKLKAVFQAMDRKTQQLQQLRDSQTRQEDYERLREILKEVEFENRYCANRLEELVAVIRNDG
jgi:hypothetical protein